MVLEGISIHSGKPIRLETENGRILGVSDAPRTETMPFVSPAFIDMQVNGFFGKDYSSPGLSVDDVIRIVEFLAVSGTAAHLPTLITGSESVITRNLRTIASAAEDPRLTGAIPGIHLEGPFISREDGPRGAHNADFVRPPDFDEFLRWQEAARGMIRVVTLSPEGDEALRFIEKVSGMGVIVSIGHTSADPAGIERAVAAGARMSTHLGNGNAPMIPRLKNNIFRQLAADELCAGIICDGFHLPEYAVKVFARAKGPDRLILVSDAAPLAGSPPGAYSWGGIDVHVYEDGHLGLSDGPLLAGAARLLDYGVPLYSRFSGESLSAAVKLCTENPARLLSIPEACTGIVPGAPADLVLFRHRPDSDRLEIIKTVRRGKTVFEEDIP